MVMRSQNSCLLSPPPALIKDIDIHTHIHMYLTQNKKHLPRVITALRRPGGRERVELHVRGLPRELERAEVAVGDEGLETMGWDGVMGEGW